MDAEMNLKTNSSQCFKVVTGCTVLYSPFRLHPRSQATSKKDGEKYRTDRWLHHKVKIEMIADYALLEVFAGMEHVVV
jgi:hypothetical protein